MAKSFSHKKSDAVIAASSIINQAKREIGTPMDAQERRQNRNQYAAMQLFNRAGSSIDDIFAVFGSGTGGTKVSK